MDYSCAVHCFKLCQKLNSNSQTHIYIAINMLVFIKAYAKIIHRVEIEDRSFTFVYFYALYYLVGKFHFAKGVYFRELGSIFLALVIGELFKDCHCPQFAQEHVLSLLELYDDL